MDRLTRNGATNGGAFIEPVKPYSFGKEWEAAVAFRLADYEDTGLSPEEVSNLVEKSVTLPVALRYGFGNLGVCSVYVRER